MKEEEREREETGEKVTDLLRLPLSLPLDPLGLALDRSNINPLLLRLVLHSLLRSLQNLDHLVQRGLKRLLDVSHNVGRSVAEGLVGEDERGEVVVRLHNVFPSQLGEVGTLALRAGITKSQKRERWFVRFCSFSSLRRGAEQLEGTRYLKLAQLINKSMLQRAQLRSDIAREISRELERAFVGGR